jgi:hypothetical protein
VSAGLIITVLAVTGVMAATLVVGAVVMRRLGARAEGRADDLRDEVDRLGEEWLIPLERASYRGARHTYGRTKNDGVAGLTGRRVLFEPIIGTGFGVPLARVVGARRSRWFLSSARAGRVHLVLTLDDGNEVAFYVADPARWLRTLADAGVPASPAERDLYA